MLYFNQKLCSENSAKYDKYFASYIDNEITPCISIAVLKNNEVVYDFTNGRTAPVGVEGKEVSKETRFNIGSVSKPITGALIIKLLEMGKLTMQDTVSSIIEEYRYKEITIHNLMTHTAGYPEIQEQITPPVVTSEKKGFMETIFGMKPVSKPGDEFSYFTWGYCLIAEIIQRVSGMSLEEFARKMLFDPAQMTHTTYDMSKLKEGSYTLPWDYEKGCLREDEGRCVPVGDRGVFTDTYDLLKFGSILLNKGMAGERRIFSEAAVEFMMHEVTEGKFMKTPNFWIKGHLDVMGTFGDLNSPSAIAHSGFTGCILFIDSAYRTSAAILTNSKRLHDNWKNYQKIINVIMAM